MPHLGIVSPRSLASLDRFRWRTSIPSITNVKLSELKRWISVMRLGRSTKDIAEMRNSLEETPDALGDVSSRRPSFGGKALLPFNGEIVEIDAN